MGDLLTINFSSEVYKKIDGGKKKALEDGEVAIQSSKCGNFDTGYRYLFLGIDTYDPQGPIHAKTKFQRDSSPRPCQNRTSTTPRRGLSPLTTPRCGREAQSTPRPSCSVLQAPLAVHDRAKATLGHEASVDPT
ncbi:hypothetical protein PIB30_085343 [Stylosanthes scabra]|uniref:Uncharacterized protein n=1 Tax=Stylosanthes scabra TaxID=79078 RepID=A0ABU6QTC0_9FABA|nr:hypothetical protein [Stylosanthes scabra]